MIRAAIVKEDDVGKQKTGTCSERDLRLKEELVTRNIGGGKGGEASMSRSFAGQHALYPVRRNSSPGVKAVRLLSTCDKHGLHHTEPERRRRRRLF
jgi:hypothetical protein